MHKISRTSLAALVCPSAPFLVPRLLRATAVSTTKAGGISCASSPCTSRSSYATAAKPSKPARKYLSRPKLKYRTAGNFVAQDETLPLLKQLREACDHRNVQLLMDLYPNLLSAGLLDRHDTRRIAQALHTRARQSVKPTDIIPFIQRMVDDMRKGLLEPHPYAFVHLLGIFKDCKRFQEGHELWQWLVQQDDTFVSQAAYGAAIELMAYGRLADLPELEELYNEGLKRFPGTFAEYHLSPDAIVPDRSQPILIPGVPTVLLQGILTARLLARDWKKAYLALDTILRLYPAQTPSRFFELFMAQRPPSEAYTAFMVACRAGTVLGPTHVTALFTKLRVAMSTTTALADRMILLRAIANAMYAYQEAGGQLQSLHVGVFVHCFENLLPEPTPGEDYQGRAAQLRNVIVLAAHEIVSRLLQAGFAAQIHPFEALVSLAGKLRVPDLLTTALHDIRAAQMDPGPIGTRSALTSAGLVRNKDLIEQLWSGIVSSAEAEGSQIAVENWVTFVKACRRAGLADYFKEQLSKLSHTITSDIEKHLMYQIEMTEKASEQPPFQDMTTDELGAELEVLKQQMVNVEAVIMSGSRLDLKESPFHMHLDPTVPSLSSAKNLRAIYDEVSTDPHQPEPKPSEGTPMKPVLSSTKIPLDELRFQNWLSILEMMDDAETNEALLQIAVTKAINAGKPFQDRGKIVLRKDKVETLSSIPELRERIRTLRNSKSPPSIKFRKVSSEVPGDNFKRMDYDENSGRWQRQKIVKFYSKDGAHSSKPQQNVKVEPGLRYYVGMKSDHEAPAKPNIGNSSVRQDTEGQAAKQESGLPSADEKNI